MSQLIINVGTTPNDGTGDTIRGAFINVNTNFSEVYNHIANLTANVASIDVSQNATIEISFDTANAAFDQANAANVLAYNTGVSANLYSAAIGAAGNAYAVVIGTSSNSYAASIGTSGNAYAVAIGTAGNNYASILSANNAAASNAWANAVGVSSNVWTQATFSTVANLTVVHTHANNAYTLANNALPNTTITVQGNVTAGLFTDQYGPMRERIAFVVNSNVSMIYSTSLIIANNANTIYINLEDDTKFVNYANVGTTIDVAQFGTGTTTFVANSPAVTIGAPNNWMTISNRYTYAKLIKVSSNTWFLTGDLKA